ncbi:MFI2 [Cordylochernes scorpioides]|uniref:MFI2 n=1 Tax=Cordylochernes scorpioides TaxID=51811 RepID=A0ABY6KL41_9ARAC|nr:MFI2 [Cordylochernes scorpioides]
MIIMQKEGSSESSTPRGKDGVERTYHKEGLLLKTKEESGRVVYIPMNGVLGDEEITEKTIVWCTINPAEHKKCQEWAKAVETSRSFKSRLICKVASDKDQCMNLIDAQRADLVTLDPGELSVAGQYHSLVPIMAETYGTGVGQLTGWVIPLATLIEKQVLEVSDCNNLVKSASHFFGNSCAPNSLIDKYNPFGDNPHQMCQICKGPKTNLCSGSDPYAEYEGAFKCLLDEDLTEVDNYASCNWGFVPAHVVATTSAASTDRKLQYQRFLEDHTSGLRPLQNMQVKGYLRESEKYFQMLQRCPVPPARLCVVSEAEYSKCNRMSTAFRGQMLKPDLACVRGHSHVHCMQLIQEQSADLAFWTLEMSTLLDKEMNRCLEALKKHQAIDVNYIDFLEVDKDVQVAGEQSIEEIVKEVMGKEEDEEYGLIPVVAEQYNLPDPAFYVVAVARQPDKDTDLLYLKGKTSCHTGIKQAAGWIIPMSFLITNDRMRAFGCNAPRAAAEFFQKSCVPGAMSREHTFGTNAGSIHNLCDLCHGSSHSFCSRDSSEPFYGNSGALRCLVEGGGQIAFVRHTTISENTAGRNQAWWSRPLMPADFELLCRDGTRRLYNESKQCNLGKVPSNAIVTSPSKPEAVIEAYIELFLYAQQYYGSKYSERFTFKMFVSPNDYQDLIFQDATQQLRKIEPERRDYKTYLGFDFLQSVRVVDCTAGAGTISLSATFITLFLSFLVLGHLGV